jgi:hypothetical protein
MEREIRGICLTYDMLKRRPKRTIQHPVAITEYRTRYYSIHSNLLESYGQYIVHRHPTAFSVLGTAALTVHTHSRIPPSQSINDVVRGGQRQADTTGSQ